MKPDIVHTHDLPWRPSPYAGVSWKKLAYGGANGISTVLLRFAPGSSYGAHRHPGGEQYLVLEGSLEDAGASYGPGTYVHHAPGSAHRPSSKEGCLLFITLPMPVEMLPVEMLPESAPDEGSAAGEQNL